MRSERLYVRELAIDNLKFYTKWQWLSTRGVTEEHIMLTVFPCSMTDGEFNAEDNGLRTTHLQDSLDFFRLRRKRWKDH